MNGTGLFDTIKDTAERATYTPCDGTCTTSDRAPGHPPRDYWERAVKLFARYGYRLQHGYLEEGCDGTTFGPLSDETPRSTRIRSGLSPAREYAVLAHEFGHVLLAHSPRNSQEVEREAYERMSRAMFRGEPTEENFDSEISCELAAVACVKAAGLPLHSQHNCYLRGRMRTYRRQPDERCLWAAHLAARTFTEAMLPVTVL